MSKRPSLLLLSTMALVTSAAGTILILSKPLPPWSYLFKFLFLLFWTAFVGLAGYHAWVRSALGPSGGIWRGCGLGIWVAILPNIAMIIVKILSTIHGRTLRLWTLVVGAIIDFVGMPGVVIPRVWGELILLEHPHLTEMGFVRTWLVYTFFNILIWCGILTLIPFLFRRASSLALRN